MFGDEYSDYTGMRSLLVGVEAYSRAFLNDPKEAAKVIIDEDLEPLATGDRTFDRWERIVAEGGDPFAGMDFSKMVKEFRVGKAPVKKGNMAGEYAGQEIIDAESMKVDSIDEFYPPTGAAK
jgi:hypothetical protein